VEVSYVTAHRGYIAPKVFGGEEMKAMGYLAVGLLLATFTINGCVTPPSQAEISNLDYGTPPQDYEATIKKYFDELLLDPYSAHYDFETPRQIWYKEGPLMGGKLYAGYLVRVGVNAKNRMGGYVGKEMYGFLFKDERVIKILSEFELQNIKLPE
jgi:hypothetical protein